MTFPIIQGDFFCSSKCLDEGNSEQIHVGYSGKVASTFWKQHIMLIFIWFRIFSVRFKMWTISILFRKKELEYQQLNKWQNDSTFLKFYARRDYEKYCISFIVFGKHGLQWIWCSKFYRIWYKCLLFLKVGGFDQVEWESIFIFNWKKVRKRLYFWAILCESAVIHRHGFSIC